MRSSPIAIRMAPPSTIGWKADGMSSSDSALRMIDMTATPSSIPAGETPALPAPKRRPPITAAAITSSS